MRPYCRAIRPLLPGLLLGLGACPRRNGEAPQAQVAPAPRSATASPPSPGPAASPAAAIAERDVELAKSLVERGRAVQRAGGEDAAEEAIALYRQALGADPRCAGAFWELGWSYQILGRLDEAVQAWQHLHELDPGEPQLQAHYPVLLMRRDQAAALAALPEPGELPAPEEAPRPGPRLRVAAVGDVQMGRAWPEDQAALPPEQGAVLFEHVRQILSAADVAFGNLETALADQGESSKCRAGSNTCYAFRAPAAFAATLAAAGFDVVSLANNHTGDFGPEGRRSTLAALDAAGVLHSGPVGDVASWEQNGLRIAMVAFGCGAGLYRVQDIDTARRVIADVDRSHDLVIVSFHAGAEGARAQHVTKAPEKFFGEDRGDVYAFAHAAVDAGADLLLGHGPHVLRAAEIYRGRLIAYSLGNFAAWYGFNLHGASGVSAILDVTLAPNGVATGARLLPVVLQGPGVPAPDPTMRGVKSLRRLSLQDLGKCPFDAEGVYAPPTAAAATPAATRD